MDANLCGLPDSIIDKVKKCTSTKQIWSRPKIFMKINLVSVQTMNMRQEKKNMYNRYKEDL